MSRGPTTRLFYMLDEQGASHIIGATAALIGPTAAEGDELLYMENSGVFRLSAPDGDRVSTRFRLGSLPADRGRAWFYISGSLGACDDLHYDMSVVTAIREGLSNPAPTGVSFASPFVRPPRPTPTRIREQTVNPVILATPTMTPYRPPYEPVARPTPAVAKTKPKPDPAAFPLRAKRRRTLVLE
jgi:hypothetical protein